MTRYFEIRKPLGGFLIYFLACFLGICLRTAVAADDDKSEKSDKPGKWIELFDGKTLDGWKAAEAKDSFTVEDGCIVAHGKPRGHLFYETKEPFKNFELEAEVKTETTANSGIYFHTQFQDKDWPKKGFEAQINNSFPPDPKRTGSLYGIVDVKDSLKDNEWFKYYIKVEGKHVIIKLNDKQVVDYTEPENYKPAPGSFERKIGEGTFALQAHPDSGKTYFRNIRVRRLP
jgi:hypothetical protein